METGLIVEYAFWAYGAAMIGFYIWSIVKFVQNRKKPAGERAKWPTVLFIILTCIVGFNVLLMITLAGLAAAIVANM